MNSKMKDVSAYLSLNIQESKKITISISISHFLLLFFLNDDSKEVKWDEKEE